MSTAEKLDFLMRLTDTQNAVLARALNFDASYISRIRSGKRGLPIGQPFVEPASTFFARHVREPYQRDALARELGLGSPWPTDEARARELVAEWLAGDTEPRDSIERTLAAIAAPPAADRPPAEAYPAAAGTPAEAQLFLGNAGRRAAVIAFLRSLCETGRPQLLLLHSDEDMAWLYEDAAFARAWSDLLVRLADAGGHIRVIHTISRDANEMWEAVRKWLPLYARGAVESYHYPWLRDGVLRRTLFVAPGHAALVANSVRGGTGEALNLLLRDRTAVTALEREFDDFLALCRPLMKVVRPADERELAALLAGFARGGGAGLRAAQVHGVTLCVRQDAGALVARPEDPRIAFLLDEPRTVAALDEYLRRLDDGRLREGEQAVALLAGTAVS